MRVEGEGFRVKSFRIGAEGVALVMAKRAIGLRVEGLAFWLNIGGV